MSVVVFMLAILGAVTTQLASKRLIDESMETELATELLRSRMADVLFLTVAEIAGGQAQATVEANNGQGGIGGLDNAVLTFTTPGYAAGAPVPDTIDVRIDLSWNTDEGRQRNLSLSSSQG